MIRIYVGKSASGKDFYLNQDVSSGLFERVVSYTTRPMRPKERDGYDYNFVYEELFLEMLNENRLLESRSYETLFYGKKRTWYYGSPILTDYENKDYVTVVDVEGAMNYIKKYGPNNCDIIYIFTDNKKRETRAKKRGGFDQTEWDRRLVDDEIKFSDFKLDMLAYLANGITYRCNNFEEDDINEYRRIITKSSISEKIRKNFKEAFDMFTSGESLARMLDFSFSNDDIKKLAKIYKKNVEYRTKILDLLCYCDFYTECKYLEAEDYDAINQMYAE